ncbi:MAG: glycosyltransferase family 39 protein [Candidatus Erginobacter occultus]|nr:glycosyltransferase family 39 protein [Candidatus Erginobacter occultus]
MKKSARWILTGILGLSLLSRIFYQAAAGDRMERLVISDMATYDLLAVNLVEQGYYGVNGPWSYRPPLYPWFLSLIYRLFGHSHSLARLVQALLAVLSVILVFYIARELIGIGGALLAAFLTAADFSLIHISGLFLSENLYIPLSLVLILLLTRGFREPKLLTFLGAGVAGGLAALCRPTVLPFLGLVFLVPLLDGDCFAPAGLAMTGKRKKRRGATGWAVMLAVAGLTIAPWTVRNWRLHRALVPISTNAGTMLWMGLHPGATGGYHYPEENNPLYGMEDEVERNRAGMKESVRFIFQYPGETLRLAVVKMRIFWRGYLFTWSGRQWLIYGILGLGGLILSFQEWRRWLLLYIYLAAFTAPHIFVHSAARYRLPLHPLIAIWAASFLLAIWNQSRKRLGERK